MARARAAYVAPMTSTAAPARSIDETLAELVEEFDLLGDWEGRIEYVIDLGKDLPPLPEEARIEANKQVRYLALSIAPVAPDEATYPKALQNTIVAFLIFAGIYLMLSLTASILREQVSS